LIERPILRHWPALVKSTPQFTKTSQLISGQDAPVRKFTHKTDLCDLRLRGLKILQPGLNLRLVSIISVNGLVERAIGRTKTLLGLVHHRLSLHIYSANLLKLLG
jgi:hypothetical protein